MAKPKDMRGQKFGRITPLFYLGKSTWRTICDCGTEKDMSAKCLLNGAARSCGCLHREQLSKRKKTHGMTGTPTYIAWTNMKARCLNPGSISYSNYGGRGIKVCQEWIDSFETFFKDMGERPEGMTLERVDTNGDYCPENCVWANWTDQMNNRRVSRLVEYLGKRMTIAQWSRETGICPAKIRKKLNSGLGPEEALKNS